MTTALSEGLVYVDEQLLVLDKPAGMLAVPGRGADKQDCLAARAQRTWADALVVHRLDQATSGLMVMARGPHAQRTLGTAFSERGVRKRYVAVVAGAVDPAATDWQQIDLPLMADWPNRPRQKVDVVLGRASRTRWRVLAADPAHPDATRLLLDPVTGRTHQLRVHLAATGHAILGDTLYAPTAVAAASPRLLLHAWRLDFAHPLSGEPMEFESALPF